MLNTKVMNQAGDVAEVAFILEAYKRGFKAFLPYSHDTKTDVVIKRPGEPMIAVQVKKGTLQKNPPHLTQTWKALVGSAKSSNRRCNGTPSFTKYKQDAFDVLAVYIQEQDKWILHKLADIVGKASIRWNDKHPYNNFDLLETYNK
jgi:hypothetical protein